MRALLLTGALALLFPTTGAALSLSCIPSEKYVCQMGASCVGGTPAVVGPIAARANLDTGNGELGSYERCDKSGCDKYQALVSGAKAFTHFELPGQGAFSKVGPGGSWVEVVSLTTTVIITYGYCSPR